MDVEHVKGNGVGKLKLGGHVTDALKVNEAVLEKETNDRRCLMEIKQKKNVTRG